MKKHLLIRDTREQRPLKFLPVHFKTVVKKLDYGDYGLRFLNGVKSKTVFERKSIPDLFGSMTSGHDRFAREVLRAQAEHVKLVLIVEGSLSKVYRGLYHSKTQGKSVAKIVFSMWIRHGLVPVFANDREEAAEFIAQYYLAEWRWMERIKK